MIFLKPITPDAALVFRAVRLRALADSPLAFSATWDAESRLSDEEWIRRCERWNGEHAIGYLAFDTLDEKSACGLVGCYSESRSEDHSAPHGQVVSMWVDPVYRRAGVGTLLIDGLKDWAKSRGLRELRLMVTSVNQGAAGFYQRMGFRMTGKTEPYPNDPAIVEHEMVLDL